LKRKTRNGGGGGKKNDLSQRRREKKKRKEGVGNSLVIERARGISEIKCDGLEKGRGAKVSEKDGENLPKRGVLYSIRSGTYRNLTFCQGKNFSPRGGGEHTF